ncbi:MAG: acetate--CoA ligase family protein [Candidatus Competibacteraceae bacterium]|nr:acetate--CoA ligase family protein [Candidatus Competibacteraceae bacterium]
MKSGRCRSSSPQPREAASEIALELREPVALKILSPDITNKSEVGGVAFGLNNPLEVLVAAAGMLEQVHQLALMPLLTVSRCSRCSRGTTPTNSHDRGAYRSSVRAGHLFRPRRHRGGSY